VLECVGVCWSVLGMPLVDRHMCVLINLKLPGLKMSQNYPQKLLPYPYAD